MTALGIMNRITKHFGWCLCHEVNGCDWSLLWHGKHVRGTWRWSPARLWW